VGNGRRPAVSRTHRTNRVNRRSWRRLAIDLTGADAEARARAARDVRRAGPSVAVKPPEARSAFARRRRERGLTPAGFRSAKAAFERDWNRMVRLAVPEDVCRAAASLAERHALKPLDSLHLASFLSLRRRLPRSGAAFSSFDRRLNRAALRARWPSV